jgi:hypothetical protein
LNPAFGSLTEYNKTRRIVKDVVTEHFRFILYPNPKGLGYKMARCKKERDMSKGTPYNYRNQFCILWDLKTVSFRGIFVYICRICFLTICRRYVIDAVKSSEGIWSILSRLKTDACKCKSMLCITLYMQSGKTLDGLDRQALYYHREAGLSPAAVFPLLPGVEGKNREYFQ